MFIHPYGVIVGVATVVGLLLTEHQFKKNSPFDSATRTETFFWQTAMIALVTGAFGARLWHVWTDWSLYQDSLGSIIKIWTGGLSILGALMGGYLGVWVAVRFQFKARGEVNQSRVLLTLLDSAAFGLPFAQAVGRLGNYVNQELYGWPTSLPWAVTIGGVGYHPLWVYEAGLLIAWGALSWWWHRAHQQAWSMGSGRYFLSYILYYSLIRFWLDFLRIEKAMSFIPGLGLNQLVLLGIMAGVGGWMWWHRHLHQPVSPVKL